MIACSKDVLQFANVSRPGIAAKSLHGRLADRLNPHSHAGREPGHQEVYEQRHVSLSVAQGRKSAPRKPILKPSAATKSGPPSLNSLLLAALRSAGRPLTAKQLVAEVKRRGFKSESADFTKMVGTRLWDLKRQGIIRRATGQPGYRPAPAANKSVQKTELAKISVRKKATATAPAKPGQSKAAAKPAPKQPSGAKVPQVPLRDVVTQVLKKMGVPLKASELAEEVLKTGYRTDSTKFVNNVFVILGRMDNVEHVAGEGYRLKRGKS
jgi:hypothetical protein